MNDLIMHSMSVFMGFFAIMNPLANTTVFVSLTSQNTFIEQRHIALKALLISFLIVLVFSLLGKVIFELFDITLPALRITGGVLVFLIGYQMLHGTGSKLHKATENGAEEDVAISPLAVPILAGPGTIATAMNHSTAGIPEVAVTVTAFAALCALTYLSFISGPRILAFLGHSGVSIVTRLMGLILTVMGVQMFLTGVFNAISQFGVRG